MFKQSIIVALPVFALFSAPASAQSTFVGPRIELQAGNDHGELPDVTGSTNGVSASNNRAVIGVGLGYDVSLGGTAIGGIDSNLDFGTSSGCVAGVLLPADQLCGKMVRDFDVGARVGVSTGPFLLYGRVAYANTLTRSTYSPGDGTSTIASNAVGSPRVGAGIEYSLGHKVYLKTEYDYTTSGDVADHQKIMGGVGLRF